MKIFRAIRWQISKKFVKVQVPTVILNKDVRQLTSPIFLV